MLILEEPYTTPYSAPYRALLGPRSLQAHDTEFRRGRKKNSEDTRGGTTNY